MWPSRKNNFPDFSRSDLRGPGVLDRFRKWMQSQTQNPDVGGPVTPDTLNTIRDLQKKFGVKLPAPKPAPKEDSNVVSIHSARAGQEKAVPQMPLPTDAQEHLDRASSAFWSRLVDECLPSALESNRTEMPPQEDVVEIERDLPIVSEPIPEPPKDIPPSTDNPGVNPAAWEPLAEEFDQPIEPPKPVSKKISGLFNRMATSVKKLGTGLVTTATQAGKTTKTALGLGHVTEHEIHDAQVKVAGAFVDMAIGAGTAKMGALIAGVALSATAAPTVALLAGTALATGTIRLAINCARDYHMKPQIGWKGLLKKNFKRAVFGAGFGLIGVGVAEGFSLADQALNDYPPTVAPEAPPKTFIIQEEADKPVSPAADSAPTATTPVLPSDQTATHPPVVNAPAQAPAPVPEQPAADPQAQDAMASSAAPPSAPTTSISNPAAHTPQPDSVAAEKAAARQAWIDAQNAGTDKLNIDTRHDITETVKPLPDITEELPFLNLDLNETQPSTPAPVATADGLELKNCQAVDKLSDGSYLLECDKNPNLKPGMQGTMILSI